MLNLNKKNLLQPLQAAWLNNISCDVLRLDTLHPVVSGNKYFKLQLYLQDALQQGYTTIATFGGPYSNHIVATAFACKEAGLRCVGFIRGDANTALSHTLKNAAEYGMELQFVDRSSYRDKSAIKNTYINKKFYWIDEGGYGIIGAGGAAEILSLIDTSSYKNIICACGTGTTMAGLIKACSSNQKITGINVLKGYNNLIDDIQKLLTENEAHKAFEVIDNYHFGGYAKFNEGLIEWMNNLWIESNMPTDIVYTSKLFYAVKDLIATNYFNKDDKLLIIHSGGLQGNLSLPAGSLLF